MNYVKNELHHLTYNLPLQDTSHLVKMLQQQDHESQMVGDKKSLFLRWTGTCKCHNVTSSEID